MVGLLSAIQPFSHLSTLTSSGHWLHQEISVLVSQEKLFHSWFCVHTTYSAQVYLYNLHRHHPLKVPIHTLVDWSLRDSFLVPREIHVRLVRELNQEPLDLQLNALPLDQRTPLICCLAQFKLSLNICIYFSLIVKQVLTTYINHSQVCFLEPTITGFILEE